MTDLDPMLPASWRGSTTIHTGTYYTNGTWPVGLLRIEPGGIEVRAFHRRVFFTPEDVVELRMFRLPFPTMEVVFRNGNGHALVSITVLRYGRLKTLLAGAGFNVSAEMTVYTGWDMAERSLKYGLFESGGD